MEIDTIIKKMEGKKLKQTEKNYLYRSIRPKLLAAKMLAETDILAQINKDNRPDASLIEYNLACYGYPLLSKRKKRMKRIPLEALIAEILLKYPYARFIEAIPFLMIKNRIDEFRLLELASKYGLKNKIGCLLETAAMIGKLPDSAELLTYLEKNKEDEIQFLAQGDYDFLLETSPKRVRKWRLLGRFFNEDFKRLAEAYL